MSELPTVARLRYAKCPIKARFAMDLTREEIGWLMNWCDYQQESLWDGLNIQEILNVYRVSSAWENFEAWAEERGDIARRGWNKYTRPENHLRLNG